MWRAFDAAFDLESADAVRAGVALDNLAQVYVLSATLAQPSTGEIWSLKLAKPSAVAMEDFHVTPLGVPPFLAPSKEAMLKPQ